MMDNSNLYKTRLDYIGLYWNILDCTELYQTILHTVLYWTAVLYSGNLGLYWVPEYIPNRHNPDRT